MPCAPKFAGPLLNAGLHRSIDFSRLRGVAPQATHYKGVAEMTTDILWFAEIELKDLDQVGGKNASLGEMVQKLTSAGVQVPDGFATTADAYRKFLAESGLDQRIVDRLTDLDTDDVTALAAAGQEVRRLMAADIQG